MTEAGRETVAVVGMGAVGTMLAAALAEAGHSVVACGATALDHIELTDQHGTRQHPVRWVTEPDELEPVSWLVLTTKIHQTASAEGWLHAASAHHVVAAQNGVDHRERIQPLAGPATVVPALVYVNAERTGPGRVRARRTTCDLVLPEDPGGRAVAGLLGATDLRVETEDDFRTAAWRKFLTNVAANPLTALTGRRVEVVREEAVAALAERLLHEAVDVGRAEGAALDHQHARQALDWLQGLTPGSTTSMLQDREAGRALEFDGLTGTVVRLGDRHGVPVDANRTVLALLSALRA